MKLTPKHQEIFDKIARLSEIGKMPHAILLSGMKGIGKSILAEKIACLVLGAVGVKQEQDDERDTETFDMFGDSAAELSPSTNLQSYDIINENVAKRLESGAHPDFLRISLKDDEKIISVDEARKITSFFNTKPVEGAGKAIIIDSICQMNNNAANAILKILEEPPAGGHLILICHNLESILPTIKSRCALYRIKPLNMQDFASIIREKINVDAHQLESLYYLSEGSIGIAIEFFEGGGLSFYESLLDSIKGGKIADIVDVASSAAATKSGLSWLAVRFAFYSIYRKISLLIKEPNSVHLNTKEIDVLSQIIKRKNPQAIADSFSEIMESLSNCEKINLDKKAILLNTLREF